MALESKKIKVIASQLLFDSEQVRRYPQSHSHAQAGDPFLVSAHQFSAKSMRLAPDSKYTFEDVQRMKADYWQRKEATAGKIGGKSVIHMNDAELLANGIVRDPYIPPEDKGVVEPDAASEEEPASLSKEQTRSKERVPATAGSGNKDVLA